MRIRQPDIATRLESFGQEHLVKFWDDLNETEKIDLTADINSIDFGDFKDIIENYF